MNLEIMAAVLSANLLTVMCVYGFMQATREEKEGSGYSWLALGCILFPLVMGIVGMLSTGYLPPSLDALAAQR